MVIEDGKFYFIKDEFFDVFKDYGLMENKDGGTKRPCYFCFRDRKNKEIITKRWEAGPKGQPPAFYPLFQLLVE